MVTYHTQSLAIRLLQCLNHFPQRHRSSLRQIAQKAFMATLTVSLNDRMESVESGEDALMDGQILSVGPALSLPCPVQIHHAIQIRVSKTVELVVELRGRVGRTKAVQAQRVQVGGFVPAELSPYIYTYVHVCV